MQITKIHPMVWVFHNAIQNPQGIVNCYETKDAWDDWGHFGKIHYIPLAEHRSTRYFESFPTEEEWTQSFFDSRSYSSSAESLAVQDLLQGFYKTTKMFLESNNTINTRVLFNPFDIGKYFPGGAMTYHTDDQQHRYFIPEAKFHTTAVVYPNDNYTGGEIAFVELDDNLEIKFAYKYKPKAGDIVVFSSKHPIYHAVKRLEEGVKYIIRMYWLNEQAPTNEWERGIAQYGAEEWSQMEEERSLNIRDGNYITRYFNGEEFVIQYLDKQKYEK